MSVEDMNTWVNKSEEIEEKLNNAKLLPLEYNRINLNHEYLAAIQYVTFCI